MAEAMEYGLPGIRSYDLRIIPDERGFTSEALRKDWGELLEGDGVVQVNMSFTYPGIVRAWHRHLRGQVDCFLVLRGAMKICAHDDREGLPTKGKLIEIVASCNKIRLVRIPGIYWHGFKVLGNEPALLIYFVNRLYDYHNPDEERRPWNDPKIMDPRTGEPYDWNRIPNK